MESTIIINNNKYIDTYIDRDKSTVYLRHTHNQANVVKFLTNCILSSLLTFSIWKNNTGVQIKINRLFEQHLYLPYFSCSFFYFVILALHP